MLLCGASAAVAARTQVLFTVDVESRSHGTPARQIWGEIDGTRERWGITRLMDIFESQGARATFYLDAYEIARYGVDPIRRAAREIHRRGHDLELHSHPSPMFDIGGMADGGHALQEAVLRRGIDLIRQWTGRTVVAHRAGAFRANADTLVAARRVGLAVDASFSFVPVKEYPHVRRGAPGNVVRIEDGTVELPVTYYHQLRLGGWASARLVDIEGSTEAELRTILDQAAHAGLCTVNVLIHSFSLSRYGRPDPAVAERLRRILAYARAHAGLEVATTAELHRRIVSHDICAGETPFVPVTGLALTYGRALEDFGKGWKNKLFAVAPAFAVLSLSLAAFPLVRRLQSQRRTRRL